MFAVILRILAIIGIVLLCILGLLIFLILLVLFVPIRYRAQGSKEPENLEIHAKVTYLLHILSVRFDLVNQEQKLIIKIFGFRLKSPEEKEAKRKKKEEKRRLKAEKKKKKKKAPPREADFAAEDADSAVKDAPNTAEYLKAEAPDAANKPDEDAQDGADEADAAKESAEAKEKKSLSEKINGIKEKIVYTTSSVCDKIKNAKDNVTYYKDFLTDKQNKKLYGRIFSRIKKILKSIFPRRFKANLHIGTGSPDTTGYICALYGILLCRFGKNIVLDADFEEKVLEGNFFLKGRILIFTFIKNGLPILLDKQFSKFRKGLKREE